MVGAFGENHEMPSFFISSVPLIRCKTLAALVRINLITLNSGHQAIIRGVKALCRGRISTTLKAVNKTRF